MQIVAEVRTRRGSNGWLGVGSSLEGPPRLCSKATTAGGNQWKCGAKGLPCQGILPEGDATMAHCHSKHRGGAAFKVDGTIPMTIVAFGVFRLGVNGATAGKCLCKTGRRGSCGYELQQQSMRRRCGRYAFHQLRDQRHRNSHASRCRPAVTRQQRSSCTVLPPATGTAES